MTFRSDVMQPGLYRRLEIIDNYATGEDFTHAGMTSLAGNYR